MKLGGFGLYKRAKKIFKPYDPKEHWYQRGKIDSDGSLDNIKRSEDKKARVSALLNYIEKLEFKSVLEFGCGWGYVTKHMTQKYKIDDYVAFDASPHRIAEAKNACKGKKIDFLTTMIEDFKSEKKFDLVFGTGVLHFVTPEEIRPTITKLMTFGNKYFIHDDPQYDPKYKNSKAYHTFSHNFKQIYKEMGYDVEIISIPNHHYMLYCVKLE